MAFLSPFFKALLKLLTHYELMQFGGGGYSSSYVYDNRHGWSRVQNEPEIDEEEFSWSEIFVFVAFISSIVVAFLAIRRGAQRNAARQGNAAGGDGGRPRQRHTTGTHAERLAAAASLIQKLPIEIYHTKEELEGMSIGELKGLLVKGGQGDEAATCVEKADLVGLLIKGNNSTSESCSICVEDYTSGDCLRVVPCGHRFHLECIDRWFLSSTDYSRPASCPMCNLELDPPSNGN